VSGTFFSRTSPGKKVSGEKGVRNLFFANNPGARPPKAV
jgi:hypothetical protein